jgi:hypothetical protein
VSADVCTSTPPSSSSTGSGGGTTGGGYTGSGGNPVYTGGAPPFDFCKVYPPSSSGTLNVPCENGLLQPGQSCTLNCVYPLSAAGAPWSCGPGAVLTGGQTCLPQQEAVTVALPVLLLSPCGGQVAATTIGDTISGFPLGGVEVTFTLTNALPNGAVATCIATSSPVDGSARCAINTLTNAQGVLTASVSSSVSIQGLVVANVVQVVGATATNTLCGCDDAYLGGAN